PVTMDGKTLRKDESGAGISVGGTDPVNGQAFDAMFFEHYGVNPFIDPEDDKFSTFAVDVDNASYTLARSYLQRNALPPKDAVRVEEFVNAIRHDYAPPNALIAGPQWGPSEHGTFAIHLEAAPSPFGQGLVLFRVGLKGKEVLPEERKRANLTFVVDVSGSMQQENRLELVKRSLFYLLDQMNKSDRVALVVYGSNARVLLPSTSLRDRKTIEDAIVRLHPEGATNAEAGLRLGYQMADESFDQRAINRIILCSDGVANVGVTDAEGILGTIDRAARRGIALSTIGFGMGNYNDVLMEKLANQGDGNYYYVDELGEARRVFVENLTGTLQTIAKQTKIQVEFDPDAVRRYRLLGYENRDVADRDFRNNAVDAGEVGAGHEVTALFEMKLDKDMKRGSVATVRIRYEDPETGRVTEEARTLRAEDILSRIQNADPTFQMDAAMAEFAEILRHSYWAKEGSLESARSLADKARRAMDSPKDAVEVVGLMDRAEQLWSRTEPTSTEGDGVRPQWEPSQDDEQ
ncbi:MAG TPA: von Willebrand factor type A domain-containing protein, partial [Candidatus Eisenbacteria bacterium]|nr:von Willebrand factor type A domain-containing protein [Candidatus Eisenbacteria bacterium]